SYCSMRLLLEKGGRRQGKGPVWRDGAASAGGEWARGGVAAAASTYQILREEVPPSVHEASVLCSVTSPSLLDTDGSMCCVTSFSLLNAAGLMCCATSFSSPDRYGSTRTML